MQKESFKKTDEGKLNTARKKLGNYFHINQSIKEKKSIKFKKTYQSYVNTSLDHSMMMPLAHLSFNMGQL